MSGTPTVQPTEPAIPQGVNPHHPCNAYPKILNADLGLVEVHPRRTKVAIVGFAESCRMQAPFNDDAYEIWGLNQLYRHIPRADRWFEIHHNWNEHVVDGTDHEGWLAKFDGPIYMTQRLPAIPNSVRYPIERVMHGHMDYFQSTPSYMMALAIEEGFQTIDIYGIDLIVGCEYQYQKPNLEFWIGVAHGRGIEVGIPKQSALLKQQWRYGYDAEPKSLVLMSELEERKAYLQAKFREKELELANLAGALQDTNLYYEVATLRVNGSPNIRLKPPKAT